MKVLEVVANDAEAPALREGVGMTDADCGLSTARFLRGEA
jgi:hypothetical protein